MIANLFGKNSSVALPTQQDLERYIGQDKSLTSCTTTAFYISALLQGINICDLSEYSKKVRSSNAYITGTGWNRPRLSQDFRDWFGVNVVSWQINQSDATDYELARAAGYFKDQVEEDFFKKFVVGKDSETILDNITEQTSLPMILTVAPGFGANTEPHTVVVKANSKGSFVVIDPDARNTSPKEYTKKDLIDHLEPNGAMSVVFAKKT